MTASSISQSIERISRMAEANAGEVGETAGLARNLEGLAGRLKGEAVRFRV